MASRDAGPGITGLGIAYRIAALGLLALILVGAVLWIGNQITGLNPFRSEPILEVGPTVVESIRDLSDLVTVEFVEYTTIEQGRDAGILNFARGDRIFLFAVARVGAGVDLGEIGADDVDVDRESNSIVVRLPEPRVLYAALDNRHTQVFDRDTGLFTRPDRDLEAEARLAAEEMLRDQAMEAGILKRATENAKLTLETFLASLGYGEVTVVGFFDEVTATPTPAASPAP